MLFKKRNAKKKVDVVKKITIVVDATGKLYKRTTIWHPLFGVTIESIEEIESKETVSV